MSCYCPNSSTCFSMSKGCTMVSNGAGSFGEQPSLMPCDNTGNWPQVTGRYSWLTISTVTDSNLLYTWIEAARSVLTCDHFNSSGPLVKKAMLVWAEWCSMIGEITLLPSSFVEIRIGVASDGSPEPLISWYQSISLSGSSFLLVDLIWYSGNHTELRTQGQYPRLSQEPSRRAERDEAGSMNDWWMWR